jgi:hypothetical protein
VRPPRKKREKRENGKNTAVESLRAAMHEDYSGMSALGLHIEGVVDVHFQVFAFDCFIDNVLMNGHLFHSWKLIDDAHLENLLEVWHLLIRLSLRNMRAVRYPTGNP